MIGYVAVFNHPHEKRLQLVRYKRPIGTNAPMLHLPDTGAPSYPLPFSDLVDWVGFDWSRFKTEAQITLNYDPTKKVVADPAAVTTLKLSDTLDAGTLFICTQDRNKVRYAVHPTNALRGGSAHLDDDEGRTIIPDSAGTIIVRALYEGEIRATVKVTIEP